jgi:hypothetical protein
MRFGEPAPSPGPRRRIHLGAAGAGSRTGSGLSFARNRLQRADAGGPPESGDLASYLVRAPPPCRGRGSVLISALPQSRAARYHFSSAIDPRLMMSVRKREISPPPLTTVRFVPELAPLAANALKGAAA